MQLRPVRVIAMPDAANYTDLHVSCGKGAPSPCTEDELVNASSLVLQDAVGARYALDAAIVNGDDVVSATAMQQGGEAWFVNFELGPDGTARFEAITTPLATLPQNDPAKHVAIVVDGAIVSAPIVQSPITSGGGQISGGFSQAEAEALAAELGGAPS
jgi:preprotein translocase subunit SecD